MSDFESFKRNFENKVLEKMSATLNDDVEIDGLSLMRWFIEEAYEKKWDDRMLRNFHKIFAKISFLAFLEDQGSIIEITGDQSIDIPVVVNAVKKAVEARNEFGEK
jgi:hypothetical protein